MKVKTIKIKKNPNGDTRTAPRDITLEQFRAANKSHISDVSRVMTALASMLARQGVMHDWTKVRYEDAFFDDFNKLRDGDFTKGKWYKYHVETEKHHPFSNCHDDITLLDLIETIVDCVCAGKARSGKVTLDGFPPDILEKAVKNTIALVDAMTEVEN